MSKRRGELLSTQEELGEEARRRMAEANRGELLGRIRRFFGLQVH